MANEDGTNDDEQRRRREEIESNLFHPLLGRLILSSSPTPIPVRQTYGEREDGIIPGRPPILRPASTSPSLSSTGLSTASASSSQAQVQDIAALVALTGCGIAVLVTIVTLLCCHYCCGVSHHQTDNSCSVAEKLMLILCIGQPKDKRKPKHHMIYERHTTSDFNDDFNYSYGFEDSVQLRDEESTGSGTICSPTASQAQPGPSHHHSSHHRHHASHSKGGRQHGMHRQPSQSVSSPTESSDSTAIHRTNAGDMTTQVASTAGIVEGSGEGPITVSAMITPGPSATQQHDHQASSRTHGPLSKVLR